MHKEPCACSLLPPSRAIYGTIELQNGLVLKWLDFIDGRLALEDAKAEAVRVTTAHWRGVTMRCWAD